MNIGKRGLVALFGLTIVFSLAAFASACDATQVIMKLNKTTNSHGALWSSSDSDYGIQRCYDSISGAQLQGTDLHSCTDVRPVIYLSGSSNAHASNASSSEYNNPVCYQGLQNCEIVRGSCPSGKTPIIYLSNYTDAHISIDSAADYPYTACCTLRGGTTIITPPTGPTQTRCRDYTSSTSCNNYSPFVANNDPGCLPIGSSCQCVWDASAAAGQKCKVAVIFNQGKCYCLKTVKSETACIDGVKTVTFDAVGKARAGSGYTDAQCVNAAACTGGPVPNVPCGPIGELPFFGGLQFALALMGILIIYSAFAMLKKHS